jgi:hypothetical protein
MTYIIYQNPTDYKVIRALAAGSFQEALAHGVQAWDGSTIDDDPNVKRSMQKYSYYDPEKLIELQAWHRRHRIVWADHYAQRIRDAGYNIVVDGPNAVVLAQEVDADFVAAIVRQHGLDMLPHQFHSIVALPPCQGVPLFRAVVSYAGMHVSPKYWCRRADRFVVGAAEECLLDPDEHVVDTLKKAKNRAVKIVIARDRRAAMKLRQEDFRVRQEIEKRKLAADAAALAEKEAEVDRIAGAFA